MDQENMNSVNEDNVNENSTSTDSVNTNSVNTDNTVQHSGTQRDMCSDKPEKCRANTNTSDSISIPKPVFALIIILLCGAMCFAAYNAGVLEGMDRERDAYESPDDVPEEVPGNGPKKGIDDFFREQIGEIPPFKEKDQNAPADEGENNPPAGDVPAENEEHGCLDVVVQNITEEDSQNYHIPLGVMVVSVDAEGAAAKAGIKDHSIITEMDGRAAGDVATLKGMLAQKRPGDRVEITLYEPAEDHGYRKTKVVVELSKGDSIPD